MIICKGKSADYLELSTVIVDTQPDPEKFKSQPTNTALSSNPEADMYRLETQEELDSRDPEEVISIPIVHTVEKAKVKWLLSGKTEYERRITFRKMKRGHYKAHYAKDTQGNYIGTHKPAFDAGLVYVYSSTTQDIDDQIKQVAFGREHHASIFGKISGGGAV